MALLGLTLNFFYIEYTNSKKLPRLMLLHLSAVCECVAAALVTLLLFDPVGKLTLTSCRPTKLQVGLWLIALFSTCFAGSFIAWIFE